MAESVRRKRDLFYFSWKLLHCCGMLEVIGFKKMGGEYEYKVVLVFLFLFAYMIHMGRSVPANFIPLDE